MRLTEVLSLMAMDLSGCLDLRGDIRLVRADFLALGDSPSGIRPMMQPKGSAETIDPDFLL
jgi:hypothetical protein